MSGVAGIRDTCCRTLTAWRPVRLSVACMLKQMLPHLFHPADYLLVWLTRHVTHILNINAQQRPGNHWHDQHRGVTGEGKQTFRR